MSVFNAGTRSGLAGETLDALVGRGFAAGEVGNGPSGLRVLRVQVWSTEKGDPAARLVARQFGPGVKVKLTDEDLGGGVDVLVGDDFKRLSPAPRKIRVQQAQEYCVPAPETAEPID